MREETESQAQFSPVLPQGAAGRIGRSQRSSARPLPSTPGPAAIIPKLHYDPQKYLSPRHPAPSPLSPVPCKLAQPPGTQDTSALRGEDQENRSAPTPTPISLSGVSRRPRYPSRPAGGPRDSSGSEKRETNRVLLPVRLRQHPARTCFPHVFFFPPLGACTWRPLPARRKYCVKGHLRPPP